MQQRDARGWLERWRERRRAKRQQALERSYFELERARKGDAIDRANVAGQSSSYWLASSGFWDGGGGDGGGGGG